MFPNNSKGFRKIDFIYLTAYLTKVWIISYVLPVEVFMGKKKNDSKKGSFDNDVENEFFDSNSTDGLDEEVLRKAFKPKWQRNPYISFAIIPVCVVLIYFYLLQDVVYGIRGLINSKPKKLGDISETIKKGKLKNNTYVTFDGLLLIQTQLPVPKGKRGFSPKSGSTSKGYYIYYVIHDTNNNILVKLESKTGQIVENLPKRFTGRLLKLNDITEGSRVRLYYRNNVKDPSSDIVFRSYPWANFKIPEKYKARYKKNLEELVKSKPIFITDEGKPFSPNPGFKVDIKAFYLPDVILSFKNDKKNSVEYTLTPGSSTGTKCPVPAGGNIVLQKSAKILELPEYETIEGISFVEKTEDSTGIKGKSCPVCKKDKTDLKIKDKIVLIPLTSRVYDVKAKKYINFDKNGKYVFKGSSCGKKVEKKIIRISHKPFGTLQDCYRWLANKKYPFAVEPNNANSNAGDWDVVTRVPEEDLELIKQNQKVKKICTKSKFKGHPESCEIIYPSIKVTPRWKFIFKIPLNTVKIQENKLLISNARTDFPKYYNEEFNSFNLGDKNHKYLKTIKLLQPEKTNTVYSIPLNSITKFKFYPPTMVPDDAYILIENEKPTSFSILWKIPITLILLLLIAFNIKAIVRKFS
jgi:hypothetical protein